MEPGKKRNLTKPSWSSIHHQPVKNVSSEAGKTQLNVVSLPQTRLNQVHHMAKTRKKIEIIFG